MNNEQFIEVIRDAKKRQVLFLSLWCHFNGDKEACRQWLIKMGALENQLEDFRKWSRGAEYWYQQASKAAAFQDGLTRMGDIINNGDDGDAIRALKCLKDVFGLKGDSSVVQDFMMVVKGRSK